jgi:hypothetical protein
VDRGTKIKLSCATVGAQLAYQWVGETEEAGQNWTIYQGPVKPHKGDTLLVQAHRIGYRLSKVITIPY